MGAGPEEVHSDFKHERLLRGRRQIQMMAKLELLVRLYDRLFTWWLKELGMTSAQFRVFRQICCSAHIEWTVGALKYRLGWGEIDVTRMVRRFELRGLVKRCIDPNDRRVIRIRPLPEAFALNEELEATAAEFHAGFCSTVNEEDLDIFERCLDNLLQPGYISRLYRHLDDRQADDQTGG